jgi:shikimate dehydrogenase
VSVPNPEGINASTRFCAVFGQPVKHSASPAMHNAAMRAAGLNWRYLAFEVPLTQLRAALDGCKALGFIGVNLTVPHKLLALDLVDVVDPSAAEWGAINTVRFEGLTSSGKWESLALFQESLPVEIRTVGFNTDADAIVQSLTDDLGLQLLGKKVLLLGAGGAGRVAAIRLARSGVSDLFLVNRTTSKLDAIVNLLRERFPEMRTHIGYPKSPIDLVLNATSLGLKSDDPLPYDPEQWSPAGARLGYDMIYQPAETLFLRKLREAGARTTNGLGMLLYQGAKAFEIWSGRKAPVEVMRQALQDQVYPSAETSTRTK